MRTVNIPWHIDSQADVWQDCDEFIFDGLILIIGEDEKKIMRLSYFKE